MAYQPLCERRDYYVDVDGRWVFTAAYLLRRGYCCGNGCRHCPYTPAGAAPVAGRRELAASPISAAGLTRVKE